MVQTCTKCSRANPAEAVYCYHDGFVLGGHERRGGPVAVGAQAFASPFVFPTGRSCRSFNELALACQEEWAAARDLLRQGVFRQFLATAGRLDLARVAQEAMTQADPDIALPLGGLAALVDDGVVGSVAPAHVSVMGYQQAGLEVWRAQTAPAIVELLRGQGTDGVILAPV